MWDKKARLLIFTKAPIPGQVKTRLSTKLGDDGAAELYCELLRQTITTAVDSDLCPVELWCTPTTDHPFFSNLKDKYGITLHTQVGQDLGQRMSHAIAETLKDTGPVILIGSDCPSLTLTDLYKAHQELSEASDAVLGPATDGGYYLLGLNKFSTQLFDEIHWGTDQVLQTTRNRLQQLGWQWHELAEYIDIDRPDDLAALQSIPSLQKFSSLTS